MTLNGGLFSFDGVHPGFAGHALLAVEMRRILFNAAAARPSKTVGGLGVPDIRRIPSHVIQRLYQIDPVMQFVRCNQMPSK